MENISTLRVSISHWLRDEDFAVFKRFLKENKECINRVALFSSGGHTPLKLETAVEHAHVLKSRIKEVQSMGFSAGINILATLGHHPQYLDRYYQSNHTHMTNKNGETCLGSYCPGNEEYLNEYVRPLYLSMLSAEPEFIWVDDDVRYGHFPIGYGCFCNGCIDRFNKEFGYSFTRDTLVKELEKSDSISVRKEWLQHQSGKIERLLTFIADTAYSHNPNVKLGLMTGERYFEGFDFEGWAKALSQNGKHKIMWRPGGGAYDDLDFTETVDKSVEVGRQSAYLPDYVDEVAYELESWPYQPIKKSPRSTVIESILSIANGCNAVAWNLLPERLENAQITFDSIKKSTPFIKKIALSFDRGCNLGVYDGWHPLAQSVVPDFFGDYGGMYADGMREIDLIGLPRCYNFYKASAYVLKGNQPWAFSDSEIMHMLSKGIYADAPAIKALCDMGYGKYTGFKVGEPIKSDLKEVYLNHFINRGFEGSSRSCFEVLSKGRAFSLIPDAKAEIICNIQDLDDQVINECSMGYYRNELGGKIVAAGYYPWIDLVDDYKSLQMKRIFRLLAEDAIQAYVYSYNRLRLYVRETNNNSFGIIVFNCNFDIISGAKIYIESKEKVVLWNESMKTISLNPIESKGKGSIYDLPELLPYSFCMIEAKK